MISSGASFLSSIQRGKTSKKKSSESALAVADFAETEPYLKEVIFETKAWIRFPLSNYPYKMSQKVFFFKRNGNVKKKDGKRKESSYD